MASSAIDQEPFATELMAVGFEAVEKQDSEEVVDGVRERGDQVGPAPQHQPGDEHGDVEGRSDAKKSAEKEVADGMRFPAAALAEGEKERKGAGYVEELHPGGAKAEPLRDRAGDGGVVVRMLDEHEENGKTADAVDVAEIAHRPRRHLRRHSWRADRCGAGGDFSHVGVPGRRAAQAPARRGGE